MASVTQELLPTNERDGPAPTVVAKNLPWGGAGIVPQHPWGVAKSTGNNIKEFTGSSFKELMSEDLAKELQLREEQIIMDNLSIHERVLERNVLELENASDTTSDLLLAHMLQHDFNREYDNQIQREENHLNKNSKLSISFNKYKICPESYGDISDEEYLDIDEENRALDSFEERGRNDPVIPACGYTRHNNQIVTKHDTVIAGRKNAERVMNFPPGVNTGDAGSFDMNLSNKVYNKLMRSTMAETKRKQRVNDKVDKATSEKALDPKTRLIIYKMVNNSILETVSGIVSTGKESVVFHAHGGIYEDVQLPEECAVKVFKSTLTDFKTRERYIKEDYRFRNRMSKNNNKMMIKLWAEKEFHNLRRLQKAGIPSPKPLLIKQHLLIMSFIGYKQLAAPKLKHAKMSYADWCIAYEQVIEIMTKMFQACKLVHGDLSEYNVLWYEEQCWVIDLGQAVEPSHPNALHFLHRDCSNILGFFKSKGLSDLPSPLKLFEKITGIDLPGQEEEAERLIEQYETNQELWRESLKGANDQFEFLWNEIQKEENLAKKSDNDSDEVEEEFVHLDIENVPLEGSLGLSDFSPKIKFEPLSPKKKKKGKKNKSKVSLNVLPTEDFEDNQVDLALSCDNEVESDSINVTVSNKSTGSCQHEKKKKRKTKTKN